MLKETVLVSGEGSLTVAWQVPAASGSEAAMLEVPPTVCVSLAHETVMLRYTSEDQTTETCIDPSPANCTALDVCAGGSSTPSDWLRSAGIDPTCAVVVVVVVEGSVVVVGAALGAAAVVPVVPTSAGGAGVVVRVGRSVVVVVVVVVVA